MVYKSVFCAEFILVFDFLEYTITVMLSHYVRTACMECDIWGMGHLSDAGVQRRMICAAPVVSRQGLSVVTTTTAG